MFLESDETHKQPSVPLKESSNTWMWRDKSKLTLHMASCFVRQHLMEVFKIRLSLQLPQKPVERYISRRWVQVTARHCMASDRAVQSS